MNGMCDAEIVLCRLRRENRYDRNPRRPTMKLMTFDFAHRYIKVQQFDSLQIIKCLFLIFFNDGEKEC
jgi:hypothetical protein